jgi:hypothetical protein
MTVPSPLRRVLRDASTPPLRLLPPPPAADSREQLQSPPRLAAHLRVVHDVARQIADWAGRHHPSLMALASQRTRIARRPYRRMPAADRCSAVTPPSLTPRRAFTNYVTHVNRLSSECFLVLSRGSHGRA